MFYTNEKCEVCGQKPVTISPVEWSSKKVSFIYKKKCLWCKHEKIIDGDSLNRLSQPLEKRYI